MNSYKREFIHERSKIIPIPKISPTNKKVEFSINEYSLNKSFFDPSKSSPPNEFMLKLQLRMNHYESFNNFDNLINE
jgi:hypothetical protein